MINNSFSPFQNKVPIINQPFKVFECIPTAVMQCNCRDDNSPITIPGIDVFKKCEHCGKIYGITGIQFDRRVNQFVIFTISIVNIRGEVGDVKE